MCDGTYQAYTAEEWREICMIKRMCDGTYKAYTSEEWREVVACGVDVAHIGMVKRLANGQFEVYTKEQWGKKTHLHMTTEVWNAHWRATAEANGNSIGRPVHDHGAKCIELNELSQTTGWYSRTRGKRNDTFYGHPILAPYQGKAPLSFIKAKIVAKKAGDERSQKRARNALQAGSSSDPMVH